MKRRPVMPPLLPEVVAELELYSVEDLSRERAGTPAMEVRLRNALVKRSEIEDWIKWKNADREWKERRDTWRFWITLVVASVAAVAAIIAVIEGLL